MNIQSCGLASGVVWIYNFLFWRHLHFLKCEYDYYNVKKTKEKPVWEVNIESYCRGLAVQSCGGACQRVPRCLQVNTRRWLLQLTAVLHLCWRAIKHAHIWNCIYCSNDPTFPNDNRSALRSAQKASSIAMATRPCVCVCNGHVAVWTCGSVALCKLTQSASCYNFMCWLVQEEKRGADLISMTNLEERPRPRALQGQRFARICK